jgi:hypothetical protein
MKNSIITAAASINSIEDKLLSIKLNDAITGNVPSDWINRSNRLRSLYSTDKAKYKQHKSKAAIIMPSGVFGPRKEQKMLKTHSGYMSIDIDPDHNPKVNDWRKLKKELSGIVNIAFIGHSLSGEGLWGLIPIDLTGCQSQESIIKKHRSYAKSLMHDFKSWGVTLDPSCSNVNRLRYYAVDEDPYVKLGAVPYKKTLPEKKIIQYSKRNTGNGLTPWDAYNNDTSNPHLILLQNRGWNMFQDLQHCQRWTRPEKSTGISASYDVSRKWFFVFTSSTDFDANDYYTPFEIYVQLEAEGNIKQAISQLKELGYGTK